MSGTARYTRAHRATAGDGHLTGLAGRIGIAGLLLWAGAAFAGGAADHPLRPVLEKRYAELRGAMTERDAKAIAALLAPDFASEEVNGKTQDGDAMVRDAAARAPDPNRASETTLLSIRQVGNLAIVSQRYHMTTLRLSPLGLRQAVDLVALSTDTWIKLNGVWLLQRTVTEELRYGIDGQEVLHQEHEPTL